jgi:uncharacterized protein YbcC (UPF0753/DUF2309 family)
LEVSVKTRPSGAVQALDISRNNFALEKFRIPRKQQGKYILYRMLQLQLGITGFIAWRSV